MSIATVPYFDGARLRQRFTDALNDALQGGRLSASQHRWLQGVANLPETSDPVRVDRLVAADPGFNDFELSATLMFSHGLTDDPAVYLYSLSKGIEWFADRHRLLAALRRRYAPADDDAVFESEKVDGDPFPAQMLALVDHQAARLGQFTEQLKQMPRLSEVMSNASTDSAVDLAQRFGDQLKAFWQDTWQGSHARRDAVVEAYMNSVHDRIYRHETNGPLVPETRRVLLAVLGLRVDDGPVAPWRCHRLAIKVGGSATCALAGTFVVKPVTGASGPWLWFSPDHQWLSFADASALTAHFATPDGLARLRLALALEEHSVLQCEGRLQLDLIEMPHEACHIQVDAILAMQARNLAYASRLICPPDSRGAMIDDALDIRALVDPRSLLFTLDRWQRDVQVDFTEAWAQPLPALPTVVEVPFRSDQGAPAAALSGDVTAESEGVPAPSWRERTRAFDRRASQLRESGNVLLDQARDLLERSLCVWNSQGGGVMDLQVSWHEPVPLFAAESLPEPQPEPEAHPEAEPEAVTPTPMLRTVSMPLVSLLLECVSGCRPLVTPEGTRVHVDGLTTADLPPVALIDHVLVNVCPGFVDTYVHRFEQRCTVGQRQGDRQFCPEREALNLREDAMRLYLALATRQGWIDEAGAALARQVLDQPVAASRTAASQHPVEAFQLWISYGQDAAAQLCDALALRQPGSIASPVVLWSSAEGWQSFASPEHLQDMLQRRLGGSGREPWLQLLAEADRAALCDHLHQASRNTMQLRLERVDGHAFETLQDGVLRRGLQDLRQLCARAARCQFDARLFLRAAAHVERDQSLDNLIDQLSVKVETSLFEALLPPWITAATVDELGLYCDLLKRYYLASDGGKGFLYGVPSLHTYARDALTKQLALDFPGQDLDPDGITVVSRSFVNAFPPAGELPSGVPAATIQHRESLTEYAINRFASHQGAVLSVTSDRHPQVTHTMTPDYLRQLVRGLDVGAGFLAVLRQALNPADAHYAARNRLFVQQLPPLLLAVALAEKLKGKLSPQAYDLLACVFEMPDGIAREPVNGLRALFSPLQLVADTGMTPDPVTGVFVIYPEDVTQGPWVLYVVHHSLFTFREFPNQEALLEDIRTDLPFQQMLLERVDPEVHRRYDHGGFIEPHLPFSVEGFGDLPFRAPGPVTLGLAEVKGNAMQSLFKSTIRLLLDLGVSNLVTNEQEDQAGRTFLATLGFEQVLNLLPNKLAAMVTVWQTQALLQATAASVSGQHWGEAFSEFTAALGVMVTAREQALQEQILDARSGAVPGAAADEEEELPSASSWGAPALDPGQKLRLQRLEAQGVALTDLRHDSLLNLYVDTEDGTTYAVVAGKVYRVRQIDQEAKWIIVGADGSSGPKLTLDGNQRWHLDLTLRLRGGGAVSTKIKEGKVDKSAKDILVIEARGMPEIRLLYRDRARRIGQAHLRAKRYLENALDNLSPHTHGRSLDPRVTRIIADYFGIQPPTQALLNDTLSATKTLYSAIMDASLSPFSSQRFVVGSTRPGHDSVTAFVIKADPLQRIYLTEQFFISPAFAVKPDAIAQGFSVEVHHRAANLMHELTHLVLDTHDIAYLEAMAPYPDLLLDDTPLNARVRDSVERLHVSRMSHRTVRDELFTLIDAGLRRDIEPEDGRGFEQILEITRTADLDDARDAFLSDQGVRSQLIFRNADSVTLLMLQLGRENFVLPSP